MHHGKGHAKPGLSIKTESHAHLAPSNQLFFLSPAKEAVEKYPGAVVQFPPAATAPLQHIYTACLLLDKIPSLLCYLGVPFQFFEQDVRNLVTELEGWLSS